MEITYHKIHVDSTRFYDDSITLFLVEDMILNLVLGDDSTLIEHYRNMNNVVVESSDASCDIANQLISYFRGRLKSFDFLPYWNNASIDKSFKYTNWQKKVWIETMKIPYGTTVTYGELARRCDKPGGARAVGNALGKNPIPIIVPCHRIVSKKGAGGFSTPVGLKQKKALILHEILNT